MVGFFGSMSSTTPRRLPASCRASSRPVCPGPGAFGRAGKAASPELREAGADRPSWPRSPPVLHLPDGRGRFDSSLVMGRGRNQDRDRGPVPVLYTGRTERLRGIGAVHRNPSLTRHRRPLGPT